jgi:hypothetical protein
MTAVVLLLLVIVMGVFVPPKDWNGCGWLLAVCLLFWALCVYLF